MKKLIFIGMDVHKESIVIAIAENDKSKEVRLYGKIINSLDNLERTLRKIMKAHPECELRCVYEAGPTGYVIYRRLKQLKIDCIVTAPSLIPKKSGVHIKTDNRDALELARLHRAGELTCIQVPTENDEAIRDLIRTRHDAIKAQRASRYQLKGFLLRHGYNYQGKTSWNQAHMRYLRELVMSHPAHKVTLEEYIQTVDECTQRIVRLTEHIETLVRKWERWDIVEALMSLRGVQILTAATLVAEINDITRFKNPRQLMAYLGMVPSENTTGKSRRQGGITKTGNAHARWMLIEVAHHCRMTPKISKALTDRVNAVPKAIAQISWNAQVRLHKRFWALSHRGLPTAKIVVAVARELVGFVWAIARTRHGIEVPTRGPATVTPARKRTVMPVAATAPRSPQN